MNKIISSNITNLKNKIQAIYGFTLINYTLLILTLNLASINISNSMFSDIIKGIVILSIGGTILSMPVYLLEKRIKVAYARQLKISNYLLNAYFCTIIFIFYLHNLHINSTHFIIISFLKYLLSI